MNVDVATVQFQHKPNDKRYNLDQIALFCEKAARKNVKIIAFPEMCIAGYWHIRHLDKSQLTALAEPLPEGPSSQELCFLAAKYNMIIGAGLIEKETDGTLYNAYIVCLPDGRIETHRKLHCFISEHLSSGSAYTVFDTPFGIKIGVLICYDNNLIENARITALKGADLLLAPHQTGGTASRSPYALGRIDPELWKNRESDPDAIEKEFRGPKGREWLMRWLPSRAHDNGMFILFSNGVGLDDDEVRTGNAMIIDCYGRIVAETWKAEDTIVVATLDLDLLPLCTGRRWLRARRPDLYDTLVTTQGNELNAREARFSAKPT